MIDESGYHSAHMPHDVQFAESDLNWYGSELKLGSALAITECYGKQRSEVL
jgi:hypothetical protein